METSTNWGIIGHEWAVNLLTNHIAQDRLRHAYLITGPQGIGRRTLALALAQNLNCPQARVTTQACGECQTCKRIQAMIYPDLSIVQAEQVGGTLRVEQIRELQHSLALAPYEGRYRIALFLRFEEAHVSASNALLKTLEEPNPQVILILTADSAEQLLPTILSRCEVLRLRPAPLEMLSAALHTRLEISLEQARFLAHISNGRPGKAISFHQDSAEQEKRSDILEDFIRLLSANRVERFTYADRMAKDKEDPRGKARVILQTWSTIWRDVLLLSSQSSAPLTNLDLEAKLVALSRQIDLSTSFRMIQQIESTLGWIDRNVNLRLALEVMLLNFPHLPSAALV